MRLLWLDIKKTPTALSGAPVDAAKAIQRHELDQGSDPTDITLGKMFTFRRLVFGSTTYWDGTKTLFPRTSLRTLEYVETKQRYALS